MAKAREAVINVIVFFMMSVVADNDFARPPARRAAALLRDYRNGKVDGDGRSEEAVYHNP